jgi:hypothetical protein
MGVIFYQLYLSFNTSGSIAIEADYSHELEETIEQLAAQDDVKNLAK